MKAPLREKIVPSSGVVWSVTLQRMVDRVNNSPDRVGGHAWNLFYVHLKREDPEAFQRRDLETKRRQAIAGCRYLSITDLEQILEDKRAEARREIYSKGGADHGRG